MLTRAQASEAATVKVCNNCKHVFPLTEEFFHIRKKARGKDVWWPHNECKPCTRKKAIERGMRKEKRRRRHLDRWKMSRGCEKCGYKEHACALDFHHKGDDKEGGVAGMLTHSHRNLINEVRKCVVLCANCHRVEHNRSK